MNDVHRSVVIPMYREAPRIENSIRELAQSTLRSPGTEFIFVDDGSDDGTPRIVAELLDSLGFEARLVTLERNLGKGGAVRAGVLAAHGASIAFVDADLSAGLDEVDRCLKWIESGEAEVVITTRARPDSVIVVHQPPLRQLSGKIFNWGIRALGLTDFPDTQCGLKAFSSAAARTLFKNLDITGFAFDVEVLLRAQQQGLRIVELPIQWRHLEASRVNAMRDSPKMVRDVLRLWWRERRSGSPSAHQCMSRDTFDAMARLERQHWWFQGKRALVAQEVAAVTPPKSLAVDVGCGTGAMAEDLHLLGWSPIVGTDLSAYALGLAASRTASRLMVARAEQLPLRTGTSSLLLSLDVVEHLDDDVAALKEFGRIVDSDGIVVLTVPAYQWAWSDHDVVLGHRRRYTARTLRRSAEAAGLEVVRCSYFHSWLVPIAFLIRKTPLGRIVGGQAEEASFVNPIVNRFLSAVTSVERRVIRRVSVPFGLSILLVARPAAGCR